MVWTQEQHTLIENDHLGDNGYSTAIQWLLYLPTHQIPHQGFWIFNWPKLCYHLTLKVRFVCFYLPVHVAYPRVLWLSCFHSLLLAGVCKTSQLSQFCNPCRYSIECLLLTCSAMRCSMFLLIPDRLRWWPLSHLRWIIHLRQVICPIIHLYILWPH